MGAINWDDVAGAQAAPAAAPAGAIDWNAVGTPAQSAQAANSSALPVAQATGKKSVLDDASDLAKWWVNNIANGAKSVANGYGNLYYGLAKGVADPVYGISQLALNGANTAYQKFSGPDMNSLAGGPNGAPGKNNNAMQRLTDQYNSLIDQGEKDYQGNTPGSIPAGAGRLLGNLAPAIASLGATTPETLAAAAAASPAAAPLAPTALQSLAAQYPKLAAILNGAKNGAVSASAMPVLDANGDFWGRKAGQAEAGAIVGGAIPAASQVAQGVWNTTKAVISPRATVGDNLARAVTQDGGLLGGGVATPPAPGSVIPQVSYNLPTSQGLGAPPAAQLPAVPNIASLTGNRSADDVLARIANRPQYVNGSMPTTAQVVNTPELSMAEKTLMNNPAYLASMTDRANQNNAARIAALANIAQTPDALAAAVQARGAATEPLYQEAFSQSYPIDDALADIMNRPSGQQAIARGRTIAAESNQQLGINPASGPTRTTSMGPLMVPQTTTTPGAPGTIDGQALQYLKLGIQNLRSDVNRNGIAGLDDRAVGNTANDLHNWLIDNAPKYKAADALYSSMSQPINDMRVGQAAQNALGLNTAGTLATDAADLGSRKSLNSAGDTALTLNNFQGAVKKALSAEGQYGLSPEAASAVDSIAADMQRQTGGAAAVTKTGSDTAYNLQAPNWLSGKLFGDDLSGKGMSLPAAASGIATSIGSLLAGPGWGAAAAVPVYQGAKKVNQFIGNRLNNQVQQSMLDPDVFAQLLREGMARAAQQQGGGLLNTPAVGSGVGTLAGGLLGK